jgi:hypothetical protein
VSLKPWPWPWRLLTFYPRATRREYWAILTPCIVFQVLFVPWRWPGQEMTQLGLIGATGFFPTIVLPFLAVFRRLSDLGYSPVRVKLIFVWSAAAGAVMRSLTGASDWVNTALIALGGLVVVAAGMPRGIRGESNGFPDPRRRPKEP